MFIYVRVKKAVQILDKNENNVINVIYRDGLTGSAEIVIVHDNPVLKW